MHKVYTLDEYICIWDNRIHTPITAFPARMRTCNTVTVLFLWACRRSATRTYLDLEQKRATGWVGLLSTVIALSHSTCHISTSFIFLHIRAKLRIALIQLAVGADKLANLQRAAAKIKEAASNGAQLIALPVSVDHTHYHTLPAS